MSPKQQEMQHRLQKIRELSAKGLTTTQIALRLGQTNEKIRQLVRKHGLEVLC
jgi:DNA-binding NarL/FixJ family response regulator